MKKKFKRIAIPACLLVACAALFTACADKTRKEELQSQGYKISVTYDPNGGSFLNRPGVTLMDMFNPSDYESENGVVSIKLLEPTNANRPTSGVSNISLTMPNYFFAGWYQTRELKLVDGAPVDLNGRKLKKTENDTYVYADLAEGEEAISVTPVYEYSDYWDFEEDRIEYSEATSKNGVYSMTLYAGWVPYYEFHYWYETSNGVWEEMDEVTAFDYKTTNASGSSTADKDTIFLPEWQNGVMQYKHSYNKGGEYAFPKIAGKTFSKAYTDEACTQEIVGSTEHIGTLDLETCTAVNRIQNIYVKYDEGERYQITEAKQLVDNPNLKGYYEIQADLDFTDLSWPTTFAYGTFEGKMYGKDGQNYTLNKVNVRYNNDSAKTGGIFGTLSKNAEIKNLTFENVTFNLFNIGSRRRDCSYGLFAGKIEDGAKLTDVAVGGTFKIGNITKFAGDCMVNLYANGNTEGLIKNAVSLE